MSNDNYHIQQYLRLLIAVLLSLGGSLQASELSNHFDALTPFASAQFRQERHVEALLRPLISSGSIELSDSGFIWKQSHPFHVWLTYDGVSIVEKTVVGQQETLRRLLDPVTSNFTRTMFQVMTGSLADLQSRFLIKPARLESQSGWSYELEPRNAAVKKAINRIVLDGDVYLNRIRIEESPGNYTQIELTNQRPST